ncbi:hypothetical protein MC885_013120, partial [Smutsia gigantea]
LPVSKPNVIYQWEEGNERCVLEREISTDAPSDWERRPRAKESMLSEGLSKEELFQIAPVEKHIRDEFWSSKLKTTCGCDDQLEIHLKKQERHLKEMSVTHKSTTLKSLLGWSAYHVASATYVEKSRPEADRPEES